MLELKEYIRDETIQSILKHFFLNVLNKLCLFSLFVVRY